MEKDKRGNNGVLPKEVLAENEISAVCGGGGGIVGDHRARGRVVVGLGVEKVLEARDGGRSTSCCSCFWLEREKRDLAELKLQLSGVTDTQRPLHLPPLLLLPNLMALRLHHRSSINQSPNSP